MEIRKIVFDEDIWHPLDHTIGSTYCRTFQHGNALNAIRKHWEYEWGFGLWRDRTRPLRLVLGCWWGRHHYLTWRRTAGPGGESEFHSRTCEWCRQPDPDFGP